MKYYNSHPWLLISISPSLNLLFSCLWSLQFCFPLRIYSITPSKFHSIIRGLHISVIFVGTAAMSIIVDISEPNRNMRAQWATTCSKRRTGLALRWAPSRWPSSEGIGYVRVESIGVCDSREHRRDAWLLRRGKMNLATGRCVGGRRLRRRCPASSPRVQQDRAASLLLRRVWINDPRGAVRQQRVATWQRGAGCSSSSGVLVRQWHASRRADRMQQRRRGGLLERRLSWWYVRTPQHAAPLCGPRHRRLRSATWTRRRPALIEPASSLSAAVLWIIPASWAAAVPEYFTMRPAIEVWGEAGTRGRRFIRSGSGGGAFFLHGWCVVSATNPDGTVYSFQPSLGKSDLVFSSCVDLSYVANYSHLFLGSYGCFVSFRLVVCLVSATDPDVGFDHLIGEFLSVVVYFPF